MLWVDRLVAVSLMAAAALLWQQAERFPGNGAVFPRVILGILAVLAVLLLLRTLIPTVARVSDFLGSADPRAIARAVGAFVLAAAAVLAMGHIGFFPAMIGFSILLYPLLEIRNRRLYTGSVALVLAFAYVIFVVLLNVPLTADRML